MTKSTDATNSGARVTPAHVWETMWAFGRTRALEAAVNLEIFDHLSGGPLSAADVAKAARASERGTSMLLDALVALEYLEKDSKGRYALTEVSATFLVSGSPGSMTRMVSHAGLLQETWVGLTEAVRTGRPAQAVEVEAKAREFFPELTAALFGPSFGASTMAREKLPARLRSGVNDVLDVASGSAAWSLAWAAANPDVRVTAIDFPEMHAVARSFAERLGVADRYTFRDGNIRRLGFGNEKFDLVILGHICHSEGRKHSIKLIEKSAKALRPGGLLLIGEMIPNDRRTGPAMPLLFGLNMLVNTREGAVFTLKEYREWMKASGLSSVRRLNFGEEGPGIIVGEKKNVG